MKHYCKIYVLIVLFVLSFFNNKSATCIALANGNWDTGTNWSCGAIPTCGDSVVIPAGITVTITVQKDYVAICGLNGSPLQITISGTLKFTNGNKLRLPCGSHVYIYSGGQVVPGSGGGNSNLIEICNIVVWNAAIGTLSGPTCLPMSDIRCPTFLPLELISFRVNNMDFKVAIKWATASEKNTNYFFVERSTDAINWISISKVKAAENSNQILHYEILDESPLKGISYYRLKTVDLDLSINYSAIQVIERTNKESFVLLYPNPSNGILNIASSYSTTDLKYELINVTGQLIEVKVLETNDSKIVLDISPLAKGVYFINVFTPYGLQIKASKIILN